MIAASLAAALSGCAPAAVGGPLSSAGEPSPSASVASDGGADPVPETVYLSVVDGDTIETSAGPVRIIGIDTPEHGECGDDEASAAIADVLAPGDPVSLTSPAGQNDHDKYGRLVRYVTTAAEIDLGLMQLQAGNAVARYDSRDGYPVHPRESDYRAAQRASLSPSGAVIAVMCEFPQPSGPAPGDRWWEQYSSCAKLKKNTVGHPTGPFGRDDPTQAEMYDWFARGTGNNGDGDGDGVACE